jgi:hypothetical protein
MRRMEAILRESMVWMRRSGILGIFFSFSFSFGGGRGCGWCQGRWEGAVAVVEEGRAEGMVSLAGGFLSWDWCRGMGWKY